MSVFNPGGNSLQGNPFAYSGGAGFQQQATWGAPFQQNPVPTYSAMSPTTGGSQPKGNSNMAAWSSILNTVAQYMDDRAAAKETVANAEQRTDDLMRTAYENRRTMEYTTKLGQWKAESDRHKRFEALTKNLTRRSEIKENVNPNSAIGRALAFRGNDPKDPGARPSAAAFNAKPGAALSGNRLQLPSAAPRNR